MKKLMELFFIVLFGSLIGMSSVNATPITLNVSGIVTTTDSVAVAPGDIYSADFVYETDSSLATTSASVFLGIDGYIFEGGTYGATIDIGPFSVSTIGAGVGMFVANNVAASDLDFALSQPLSLIPSDGIYDLFSLFTGNLSGSVGTSVWLLGNSNMLADTSIPVSANDLLTSPDFISGIFTFETGDLFRTYTEGDIIPVADTTPPPGTPGTPGTGTIPAPGTIWLVGLGLVALFRVLQKQ